MHYILFIPHPWVWLDLLSIFVLTHFLIFIEEHPTLPVDRVTRTKLRMAQDSDDLFVLHIVVWVVVVILAIVALHCPLPRRVVR